MHAERATDRFTGWPVIAALTLVGLALRLAAARGGMWTDEAWSVVFAAQARDPLGVIFRINHDNNHQLNTLWLQAIGMHAPSLLARAPAILAGSLTIPAAALLFARRSKAGAIAAAAFFALSPIMVTYGSEARGYATMILAAVLLIWLVTNSVEGRANRATRPLIALTAAVGLLSHLTMLAPVALLSLWVYLEKRSSMDVPLAMRETLRLMGPACLACAAMLVVTLLPALLSPTGLQTGGYNPFSFGNYVRGLSNMESWTAGLTFTPRPLALVTLFGIGGALLLWPPIAMGSRARLYGILIVGVPLVIIVERIGNAQFARFYLSAAIGLLLLGAECIALTAKSGGTGRALCAAGCALFLITAIWHDSELIELGRGQPDRAIRLMARNAPKGASVDIRTQQISAPIIVAAYQADYPLAVKKGCAPAEFMIVLRDPNSTRAAMRCGQAMHAIGWSEATDLTGDAWVLYRADASPHA